MKKNKKAKLIKMMLIINKMKAYVAQVNDDSYLSFALPDIKCSELQTTSQTSVQHNCIYATNGGYFNTDKGAPPPLCEPNLISNYAHVVLDPSNQHTNFGIDYIHRKIVVVRQGKSYINQSPGINTNSSFVTEKAPRTGIGLWKNGSIVLLQVDGEEDIKSGLDLFEFTELFTYLKVDSAVNIDGGGSSTSVYNDEVINKPTCSDNSDICQRNFWLSFQIIEKIAQKNSNNSHCTVLQNLLYFCGRKKHFTETMLCIVPKPGEQHLEEKKEGTESKRVSGIKQEKNNAKVFVCFDFILAEPLEQIIEAADTGDVLVKKLRSWNFGNELPNESLLAELNGSHVLSWGLTVWERTGLSIYLFDSFQSKHRKKERFFIYVNKIIRNCFVCFFIEEKQGIIALHLYLFLLIEISNIEQLANTVKQIVKEISYDLSQNGVIIQFRESEERESNQVLSNACSPNMKIGGFDVNKRKEELELLNMEVERMIKLIYYFF
ncbi:hypothetical protein RFI_20425, partial [Reticulomyxa filosa]